MKKIIKIYAPDFSKEDNSVLKVIKSGCLTKGEEVSKFEDKFAKYINAPYVVATNSCTSSIYLSLQYQKLHGLKKVSVPSVTFTSVAASVLHSGLDLYFVDEINVGEPYYLAGIADSAHRVSKDCFNDIESHTACYSFYPTKMLGGNEGGAIATNDRRTYNWLRLAVSNGQKPGKYSWDYRVMFPGWKMHMNDIQATILNHRLSYLSELNRWRDQIRQRYNKAFGLANTSLHVYPIMVDSQKKFIDYMAKNKIICSVHFKPLHLQPAYKKYRRQLPRSEYWGKHEVSLPLHEELSDKDVNRVIETVLDYEDFSH